jgi:hypothetical protein
VGSPPKLPRAAQVKFVLPKMPPQTNSSDAPVSTPKPSPKPKTNSASSTKISVPNGGTVILRDGVQLLPVPKTKVTPLPAKAKSPRLPSVGTVHQKQDVFDLEHRIALLTAELHQLKSKQKKNAKPATNLGVPLRNKNR